MAAKHSSGHDYVLRRGFYCNKLDAPQIPGKPTSVGQKLLNVGTSVLENFSPVNKICQHVCAFHFYANDMTRQADQLCMPVVLLAIKAVQHPA
jgi:hypothetical protein